MWQEPELPIEPPPIRYLDSRFVSLLPKCVREFINASWFIISSSEPLRYERLALAYHGFFLGDFFTPDSGFRVRQVERHDSIRLSIAKRVTDVFQSEVELLRFLASRNMRNERNHVVAPTQILWGQRIYIVPFYHEGYGNGTTPNAVLSIAKQLVEAVAFLHENRIAHLDISPRNILLASTKELEKPRLLLTDFELATIFPEGVDPIVDIWDRAFTPPEGKKAINGFLFDIFCVGHAYASYFLYDYGLRKGYPNVTWPRSFLTLYDRMIDDQPEMRPTAREADHIMQEIDENQPIPYSGGLSTRCEIDFSISTRLYPTLALDTPLPISRDFQAEEVDW